MTSLLHSVPATAGVKALLPRLILPSILVAIAILTPAKTTDVTATEGNAFAGAYNVWAGFRNGARPKGVYDAREIEAWNTTEQQFDQLRKLVKEEYRKAGLL